jgi:hypothetical protein
MMYGLIEKRGRREELKRADGKSDYLKTSSKSC